MLKFRRTARVAVTLFAAASMLVPADAQAFFGCFQKRQNATAALYGGTVCNPCGQQLVCNYVPQTCYRTQTVAVPVTTMKPVCGADPCTGCPTTVMRPVVTMQQQVQYVPYQSYRLQYSVAQPACPTATTSYYAPTLSSGVAAPGATYAAPTTAYAAPAAGCSSCNSGVAATSYYAPTTTPVITNYAPATNYAPVPTTRMLTPGVVVPGTTTYAAPSTTGAYNYPTTAGNVNVGGYSYANPGASGIAQPSMYGGTSSFTPAASAPANSAPGYATSNYGSPTLATPSYSGSPTYSGTTTTPSYSTPGTVTTVPSLSGSTYSGSTYGSSPTGSTYSGTTSNGATLNGTTLSSAAPLSSSAVSGSVNYAPSAGMVPVPNSTLSMPAPPSSSIQVPSLTSPNPMSSGTTLTLPATPTTPAAPTRSGYSSGVPSATPSATGPMMQPIPDPNMRPDPVINRELRMGPTSTPALVDPDDKTASTWRPMRAWDYQPVGNVVPATYTRTIEDSSNAMPAAAAIPTMPTTFAHSQPVATPSLEVPSPAAPSTTVRLGVPRPAMEIEVMYAPQAQYVTQPAMQPAVDRDGWRSSSASR
jgi:hypothetical protein